jgi:hypothetical protein
MFFFFFFLPFFFCSCRRIIGFYVYGDEVYAPLPYFELTGDDGVPLSPVALPICKCCNVAIAKGVPSPYMIFTENYGCPQTVLGMEVFAMNDFARNMIFGLREYSNILELTASGATIPLMKGSMIHFSSDRVVPSISTAVEELYLPRAGANEFIQVQFLGNLGQKDVINRFLSSYSDSPVRVNAALNMKILHYLKILNPLLKMCFLCG